MTGLVFQKELILTNQMHQKSMTFVTIGAFWVKNLNMSISVHWLSWFSAKSYELY